MAGQVQKPAQLLNTGYIIDNTRVGRRLHIRWVAGRKRESFLPRFCSRALMDCVAPPSKGGGRRNPSVSSRCGSPLLLLTCALLMTASHSEGGYSHVDGEELPLSHPDLQRADDHLSKVGSLPCVHARVLSACVCVYLCVCVCVCVWCGCCRIYADA